MTSWYLAAALDQLRHEINTKWPHRDRTSDGTIGDAAHASRVSAHNPDADGSVNAIDVDVDGIDLGELIAVAIRDRRTSVVISNGRYWTPATGWRPYHGVNPHNKHVHIEVYHDAREDDGSAWGLLSTAPAPQPEPTPTPEVVLEYDMITVQQDSNKKTFTLGIGFLKHHSNGAEKDVSLRLTRQSEPLVLSDDDLARAIWNLGIPVMGAPLTALAALPHGGSIVR